MVEATVQHEQRLEEARVLVELGELTQAEAEVAAILEESADDLEALRLYSKIKHMRGQLSLALACYAQLQARGTAPGELARIHLESMLRMAQDPERGAGEFLAVGQRLVQKPTAYLALEEAFRLYVARRPHEARAVCRRAAARYRDRDADVYKLAVLAQAWISELSGDLDAACAALEHLGQERGFEADLDRVMALVGLYELIGTRDKLEAAVNICRFLERSFGARFVAGRLLPLARLRSISFVEREMSEPVSVNEAAIAQTLAGDPDAAARIAADGEEALDLKCRGNLVALMEGESERAVAICVQALREDPSD